MTKFGPAVSQQGFTASNLFALARLEKAAEEMAGLTVPITILDVGPIIGLTADLRQTTRQNAIYYSLVAELGPLGYRVILEGNTLFISPLDSRELRVGVGE